MKQSDLIEHKRHPPITRANAKKQFRHVFKEGMTRMNKIKRQPKCGSHLSQPRAGAKVTWPNHPLTSHNIDNLNLQHYFYKTILQTCLTILLI